MVTRRFQSQPVIAPRTFVQILSICVVLICALPALAQETVSTPAAPTGPASGVSGTLYQYTAGGSTDSLGNAVQYSFNWGDNSHSGWTPNGVTSSFHSWSSPGTYTVTVQARSAVNTSVVSSVSPGLVVTITGENISTPSTPAGPQTAVIGTPGTYSTGGAASSLGNQVQYKLFWGDGTNSPWLPAGTTSVSRNWMWPGTFTVTAQARSAANTQILSQVSSGLTVTVLAGETISQPTAAAGPTAGIIGNSYTYSTGGATASSGNAVSYLFDWGDGATSGWLPAGAISASHTWASVGSYTITVLAADATALLIRSNPSAAVTVSITNGTTLTPSLLNMVVGDTHAIQATSAAGLPMLGLMWTSSDPTVVSLSTTDPPLLTAIAAGHVTITGGTATADVTVSAVPLPLGTVIWSNPGDGSGVQSIVPAVPSTSGVADVFAFQADGTVQAITSDGITAWTANVSQATRGQPAEWWPGAVLPDFQGGLVVLNYDDDFGGTSIMKLDGITGQPYPAYNPGPTAPILNTLVHVDGTIFALQENWTDANHDGWLPDTIVGIDPTTGAQKFSVPVDAPQGARSWSGDHLIIAGDGYAYLPYKYLDEGTGTGHIRLLRVSSSGTYDVIAVEDSFESCVECGWDSRIITNADQGVLLVWAQGGTGMAITTGTSVSLIAPPAPPNLQGIVAPMLQAQDGSFVGWYTAGDQNQCCQTNMVAFDASGTVRWTVPNETPQIALADGGVIAQPVNTDGTIGPSATIYDQNGNATGQLAGQLVRSWRGNMYQDGPVERINPGPEDAPPYAWDPARSLWATLRINRSAFRPWYFKLIWQNNCQDLRFQWPDCGFVLYPADPSVNAQLATSSSSQAAIIKSAAIEALKKAFDKWPVDVSEGTPNSGDNNASVVDGYYYDPATGTEACGVTTAGALRTSEVFYPLNMEYAQWALQIVLQTPQDVQHALSRADLMKAIGAGIGNTAAHEIGHEFFGAHGSGMHDSSTNTYNGVAGCDPRTAGGYFYGVGPIQWESITAQWWTQVLSGGGHPRQ